MAAVGAAAAAGSAIGIADVALTKAAEVALQAATAEAKMEVTGGSKALELIQ